MYQEQLFLLEFFEKNLKKWRKCIEGPKTRIILSSTVSKQKINRKNTQYIHYSPGTKTREGKEIRQKSIVIDNYLWWGTKVQRTITKGRISATLLYPVLNREGRPSPVTRRGAVGSTWTWPIIDDRPRRGHWRVTHAGGVALFFVQPGRGLNYTAAPRVRLICVPLR